MPITVSADTEGLKAAAYELMEEALLSPEEARDEDEGPERRLSPGYYTRVEYLIWLQKNIEAGGRFDLLADELEGIAALAEAKAEFRSQHPACGGCGQAQYSRTALRCHGCGVEFRAIGSGGRR